jgi:phytoene/squalene synthetase
MKALFDQVSYKTSKLITRKYSTSFSLGIYFLDKRMHDPIYAIYGFVRLADEIVDSFHDFDKAKLISEFRKDTVKAIEEGISLNPVLHSFQETVHRYSIEWKLIDTFLNSMEMDLEDRVYDRNEYEHYILGSAEVVGLMCLRVFAEGDLELYETLKPSAMKLGAAFQKVNFLRDASNDYENLGRTYFPGIDIRAMSNEDKKSIEDEIEGDFKEALQGIKQLPLGSRRGVYLAYLYYHKLFHKIKRVPPSKILTERIRIANSRKLTIMFDSLLRHPLNLL